MIGSSSVMQLRESFFGGCASRTCFYNAGGAAPTMDSAQAFFSHVSASRAPRVLLLGVDVFHFNPNDAANTHEETALRPSLLERLRRAIAILRQFTPRLASDPDLRAIVAGGVRTPSGFRGTRAILRSEGFRRDGSYSYGDQFIADVRGLSPKARSADAIQRIERNCCRLERFSHADPRALQELAQLLADARQRGSQVIAFTMPLSDELMDVIERGPELRSGFADVEKELADLFRRNAVPFTRLARPGDAGCTPAEMLDAFHPSEVCAARVLDALLGSDSVATALAPYADRSHLRAAIAARPSDLSMPAK